MNDTDWYNALFYGLLGTVLGPIIGLLGWNLYSAISWPLTGEATIAAAIVYFFFTPFSLILGSIACGVGGVLWGLFGWDLLNKPLNLTASIVRRFGMLARKVCKQTSNRSQPKASPPGAPVEKR